ncbi:MAG: hypothetical protein M1814_006398 [Vezdaea aestivalis]|nr:MAG: hypothetical protein M1814_006398 [Vezdaea aestivalis]
MSYAEVASHGPSQTAEEARAPLVPTVSNTTPAASENSLIDVDAPSVHTVPSNFSSQEIKTDTQAERLDLEAEARSKRDATKQKASAAKGKAKEGAQEAKGKAKEGAQEAEGAVKRWVENVKENRGNPVYVGNALLAVGIGAAAGVAGWRIWGKGGELNWRVAGVWGAGVGALVFGDVLVSRYLAKNKYPPK